MCMCTYVCICVCICVCMYMHVYLCVCMYACMYACMYEAILLMFLCMACLNTQYQDLMMLVESMDRMNINKKYLKYRPCVSVREDIGSWWRYAITAVLEEDVKRRTRMWSWTHMQQHRCVCVCVGGV